MDTRPDDIVVISCGESVLVKGEKLVSGMSGANRIVARGIHSGRYSVHGMSVKYALREE
jgi:hypothetical protein